MYKSITFLKNFLKILEKFRPFLYKHVENLECENGIVRRQLDVNIIFWVLSI